MEHQMLNLLRALHPIFLLGWVKFITTTFQVERVIVNLKKTFVVLMFS